MDLFRVDTIESLPESATLTLFGHLTREHLEQVNAELRRLSGQTPNLVIDLRSLSLLDRDAAHFLCRWSSQGVKIIHPPAFVERWIRQCEP
jgi:ABC-type transporter Mla MlaB component